MTKKKTRKTKTKKRSKKNKCRRSVTKQYFGGLGNQDNSVISQGIPTPSNKPSNSYQPNPLNTSQIPNIVDKQNTSQYPPVDEPGMSQDLTLSQQNTYQNPQVSQQGMSQYPLVDQQNTSQYPPFDQQDMGQDLTLSQQNMSQTPQVSQQSMSSENTYQDPQLGQQNMNLISPVGQPGMAQGLPVGDEGMAQGSPVDQQLINPENTYQDPHLGQQNMGLGSPVDDEGMGLGSPVDQQLINPENTYQDPHLGQQNMGLGSPVDDEGMGQDPQLGRQVINNTNQDDDTPTESSKDHLHDGKTKLENLKNNFNDKLGKKIKNIQDVIELNKAFQELFENPIIQNFMENADATIGEIEQEFIKEFFDLFMKFLSAIPLFGSIPIAIQAVDNIVKGFGKIAESINKFSESAEAVGNAVDVTNGEGQDEHDEQEGGLRNYNFTGGAMHRIGGSIHNFLESSKLSSKW